MSSPILVKDRLMNIDTVDMPTMKPSGMWAKTEILFGTGGFKMNPTGKSTLGETFFSSTNMVPIGGTSYSMEQLFGAKESQITIPTLYSESGIGHSDSEAPIETYLTPDGTKSVIYRYGHNVQLFGVGITGTGENDVSVYDVGYRENSININKVNHDGLTVKGTMYPFRYTASSLTASERKQYFGKKLDTTSGATGYYLKRFDSETVIKHIWESGDEDTDEELVSPSDVWDNTTGSNAIESFAEMYLTINKKDLKEYFEYIEQPDRTRFNTLALFNGQYIVDAESGEDGDYRDVRMFSKLCIQPEYLTLSKNLNIIYRVYAV